jgi:transposase InsO family protein
VENQSGRRVWVLRSDNGGEYTSNEFVEYCAAEGIKKELTNFYNPQQNGMAERENKTIWVQLMR